MPNYIEIHCDETIQIIICTALRNFARIAYPQTPNSECNLVAKDALLNAADHFEQKFKQQGYGEFNRRLRMIVKTAIEAHYKILSELESRVTTQQCKVVLKICKGETVDVELLSEAEQLDRSSDSNVLG